uniref:Clathrin_bdg domain-containing protein n=1 Tax=Panagrellus redivivus TaxID=6233 RepID=A0A7E4WC12_PANRE
MVTVFREEMASDRDELPDGGETEVDATGSESVDTGAQIGEDKSSEEGALTPEPSEVEAESPKQEEDDFDDDDFGDFEEAVAAPSVAPEPEDPFPETPTTNTTFGFADFGDKNLVPVPPATPEFNATFDPPPPPTVPSLPSLSDILSSESDLWDFGSDDPANGDALVVSDPPAYDYFLPFDTGKTDAEGFDLPQHFVDALEVWSRICFVEDTPALKLKYDKTALYEGMLSALSMSSAKAAPKDKPVSIPVMNPMPATTTFDLELKPAPVAPSGGLFSNSNEGFSPETQTATASGSTLTTSTSTVPALDANPTIIDSLSVPPVNFDWGSAGLSNPLTGAAISDFAAILDCDFASKASTEHSLEAELERLGLGRSQKDLQSFPDTQELTFGNNSLNLDDILREHHQNNSSGHSNGVVELSVDGKALLEALPDYGFMLSKMLMFPVNR